MDWVKPDTVITGACLALVALEGYGWVSMRNTLDERFGMVEQQFQSAVKQDQSQISQLSPL